MKKKKKRKLKNSDYLAARKFSIKLAVEQYSEANTKDIFLMAKKILKYIVN